MSNIKQYAHDPEDSTSLVFPIVRSLFEDRKGNLWFGHDFGLSLLTPENRETGTFIGIRNDPLDSNMITYGGVLSITELSTDSSGLWFSGLTGVKRYVPEDGTFTHILPDDHQSVPSISREVLSIYEAPSMPGSFWLATNAGLKQYDARTGERTLYNHRLSDSTSVSSDFINSIYEASFLPGILWIGTYGGGLNRFDISTGDFSHFTVEDGLPSNVVIGFVEDSSQYIWFSTHNGISRFDPRQDVLQFMNFDESDGLQDNEFNADAFSGGKSGRIYFGGINGFTAFNPGDVKINENPPSIIITDLLINNASVSQGGGRPNDDRTILSKSISLTNTVTLSHKDRVITLEFVAIDYINPAKNLYKYMLEGFDQDWVDAGTRRFVTYTNLKPGDYVFRVTGSNNHGVWNANDTSLAITITPPIWMTLWFRSISILLFISVVYFSYRKRIADLENKKIGLEKIVEERSRAAKELQNALDEVEILKNRLQAENIYLRDEIKLDHNFTNIISQNEAFKEVLYQVEQVTATDTTVFILGESGTGKELIARAVHALSDRKDRPLVKIDCASLPATLIESELFGHEKGAFTGAIKKKIGRVELANGGTLFLDEIGELPLELQPKLLRILQENKFERIGGVSTIKVDVRIIAATNRNIKHELTQGRFREDLYFRLNVFPIQIPPLRERRDDIELLVRHFTSKYSTKMGKQVKSINRETMEKLVDYDWPGNIRELENVIERGIVLSTGKELVIGDWFAAPTDGLKTGEGASSLEDMEKQYILKVLESTNWRVSGPKGAAKILKMNASTLFSRMDKFGISRK
jgi:DNA-binding NtrC family response regulator